MDKVTYRIVRIDGEVWDALKKLAVPLEDTPNDVFRRLLGLAPVLKPKGRKRAWSKEQKERHKESQRARREREREQT